jgi:4-amino-4-deoxy-L-arabinose transferase-like glycosyltransferase
MKSLSRLTPMTALLVFIAVAAAGFCLVGLRSNPPGFYIDESSVSYNAWTIATTGKDEHGLAWPFYFRAFGEYKNPVFIYLLAGLFRLSGPSVLVARAVSAGAIIAAAVVLGLLALRITRSRIVALWIATTALLTPWLFELARVAVEVALYPVALALFLYCLHRATAKTRWSTTDIATLAGTLALLTYSYSIGRVFAPLLAVGLAIFWTRAQWKQIAATWCAYFVTLVPLFVFAAKNPEALSQRFRIVTYLKPETELTEALWEFVRHYVRNINPRRLLITGDPNREQIVHLFGSYQFLAAAFVCTIIGLVIVWRRHRGDRWWRFIFYGCAVGLVPASLTDSHFHMLRLVAVPVFLLVLATPGLAWFLETPGSLAKRSALAMIIAGTLGQGALFQWRYREAAASPRRIHLFDGEYRQKIFDPAIATKANPIYLVDVPWIPGSIQAYWNATLSGIDPARFRRVPSSETAPVGGLVISTEENCPSCDVRAVSSPYMLYIAKENQARSALPLGELRAALSVASDASELRAKKPAVFRIRVTNRSSTTWLAPVRGAGSFQIGLGNHWLDANGNMLRHDDGRSALVRDLPPGETVELSLTVNAPAAPGNYILEIDMLQEGVSWFALAGSEPIRMPVRVE